MIRKRYELVVNDRSILRLKPKQDSVRIEMDEFGYGTWKYAVPLDREHILELRDTLDEILMSWFCPPEEHCICPVCEDMLTSKTAEPLVFSPADVGRLDMGEPVGEYKAPEDAGIAYVEDTIERLRRTT